MTNKAMASAASAADGNGSRLPIETACLLLSAHFGEDADVSYVT